MNPNANVRAALDRHHRARVHDCLTIGSVLSCLALTGYGIVLLLVFTEQGVRPSEMDSSSIAVVVVAGLTIGTVAFLMIGLHIAVCVGWVKINPVPVRDANRGLAMQAVGQ